MPKPKNKKTNVMFEHHEEPLLARAAFMLRLARHALLFAGLTCMALCIGILGYHKIEGLPWVDSLLNASMILGGMGPVSELHSTAGKLFASAYALFSGLMFVILMGILLAPIVHRFLHHFHLQQAAEEDGDGDDV
jgi:hypothetical protein